MKRQLSNTQAASVEVSAGEAASEAASPDAVLPDATRVATSRWKTRLWRTQLTVIGLLLLTRYVGSHAIAPENPNTVPRAVLELPARIGSWTGQPVKVDPNVFEVLNPDAAVQKRYTLQGGPQRFIGGQAVPAPQVESIVVYSRHSKGLHSPVTCLRSAGWTVTDQVERQISDGSETLAVSVITGERRSGKTQLAYYYASTDQNVKGILPTIVNLAGARMLRRKVGAVQVQFAFDGRVLRENGDFAPEFSALALGIARSVRRSLEMNNAREQDAAARPAA